MVQKEVQTMNFTSNGEPLFEQIVNKIRGYIDAGVYAPDEKLPSVREFAASMSVNPKTVVRAYEILEQEGVLYSLQKKGYYVSPKQNRPNKLAEFKKMLEHFSKQLTKEEMLRAIEDMEADT
ncbi:MAG: GntR family transcriptional regulator [Clostridia bacterium]|nr:GntR family transcriptional regulator [Clostridia bacterium]